MKTNDTGFTEYTSADIKGLLFSHWLKMLAGNYLAATQNKANKILDYGSSK